MNKELLGIIFLPAGVISMCLAALWQMYVMMTESYTLLRFPALLLVVVCASLF